MNSTTRRLLISAYAEVIANVEHPVALQREAMVQLKRLLKSEIEYMDKPKTATECVDSCAEAANRPTPATDLYVRLLRFLQVHSDENLPASTRLAAYDELQTAMYREKYKFERAADEEHKKVMLTRAASVAELERNIDEFLKDREHYRSRASMDGLGATLEYDRKICTLIKNYVRHTLKLPTL